MRIQAIATAIALLGAVIVGPGQAAATSAPAAYVSSACSSTYRISDDDATCLKSEFENRGTHGIVGGGASYGAHNSCHAYGKLVVSIDIKGGDDIKGTLRKGFLGWLTGETSSNRHIREITCCIDKSDLCFKEQVEASDSGKVYHVVHPTYTWVSVATHQQRYDFCQANPDYIYCTVDPKGDALQNPATMPGDCDGSPCTIQDCRDRFALSSAAGSPSSCTDLSLRYPDWPGDPNRSYDNRPDDEWTLSDEECWVRHARECTAEDGSQKTADMMDADTGETTWDAGTDYIAVDAVDMNDLLYCESWREDNCQTGGCYKDYRLVYGACPDDDDTTTSTATTTGSN